MSGATPDCDAGDSGCGPGFDGPPPEGSIDADVAADAPDGDRGMKPLRIQACLEILRLEERRGGGAEHY
jgi:hypothetical protein